MNSVEMADLTWRHRLLPPEAESRRRARAAFARAIAGALLALCVGVAVGLAVASFAPWALEGLEAPLAMAGG